MDSYVGCRLPQYGFFADSFGVDWYVNTVVIRRNCPDFPSCPPEKVLRDARSRCGNVL
jgi:hypothetical protein